MKITNLFILLFFIQSVSAVDLFVNQSTSVNLDATDNTISTLDLTIYDANGSLYNTEGTCDLQCWNIRDSLIISPVVYEPLSYNGNGIWSYQFDRAKIGDGSYDCKVRCRLDLNYALMITIGLKHSTDSLIKTISDLTDFIFNSLHTVIYLFKFLVRIMGIFVTIIMFILSLNLLLVLLFIELLFLMFALGKSHQSLDFIRYWVQYNLGFFGIIAKLLWGLYIIVTFIFTLIISIIRLVIPTK